MQEWLNGCVTLSLSVFAEEHSTTLKLKSMRVCLQDKRVQWLDHLGRKEERAWFSKCRTFKVVVVSPGENLSSERMKSARTKLMTAEMLENLS